MKRKHIPQIMATQHPDNAFGPDWRNEKSPYISTQDEVPECYHALSDLQCDEYMWDWEGKFVDEAVIDRLYHNYPDYFKKNPLGLKKFLTFRIPNTSNEKGTRLARAFMGIITAAQAAKDLGVHYPPLFEVILPMTTHAEQLIHVIKKFKNLLKYEKEIFNDICFGKNKLEMIPLIEGSVSLLESKNLLKKYVSEYRKIYGIKPEYLRPFIARSDPALDAGFVPASLSAIGALSEYYQFQRETKIKVYPIIGAGSLNFRGGFSPDNLKIFLDHYAGVHTVTIQSSYRYDHDKELVKKSIAYLKRSLPKRTPRLLSESEMERVVSYCSLFANYYRSSVQEIAKDVVSMASYIPKNRERIPHTGHFGYSRKIGNMATALPRAIGFTAVFYSLGIPSTFVGTGRGLRDLIQSGEIKWLEKFLPHFKEELRQDMTFLNKENLDLLVKKNAAWKSIREDVTLIQDYLETKDFDVDIYHRNASSNILHYWKQHKYKDLTRAIIKAARLRKSLG